MVLLFRARQLGRRSSSIRFWNHRAAAVILHPIIQQGTLASFPSLSRATTITTSSASSVRSMNTTSQFRPTGSTIATISSSSRRSLHGSCSSPNTKKRRRRVLSSSTAASLTGDDDNNNSHSAYLARMMVPSDANVAGNVHGGTIMKLMEEAAGFAANRYFNPPTTSSSTTTSRPREVVCALTSRVERMTFQQPVHVGDIAKVHAQVVFASVHTVAVTVHVTAERMAWSSMSSSSSSDDSSNHQNNKDSVCNRALLWLVGVVLPNNNNNNEHTTVLSSVHHHEFNPKLYTRAVAPKFTIPDPETNPHAYWNYQRAAQAYDNRIMLTNNSNKESVPGRSSSLDEEPLLPARRPIRSDNRGSTSSTSRSTIATTTTGITCFTPDYSAVELAQVMLPSDCTTDTGLVSGGVVMKLMDNAAGIVAVRHCGTNVVTVSVDCVNFTAPVLLGDILKVRARPTFTSAKSMEIQVSVVAERFSKMMTTDHHHDHHRNVDDDWTTATTTSNGSGMLMTRHEIVTTERAFFTFVSLPLFKTKQSSSSSSLPMRPLVLQNDLDKEEFEKGKQRYERRQALRTNND